MIELEIYSKTDEYFRGFTSIILYDNFFTSYYEIIMRHTPKDKKQEIKNIAKEAMKRRGHRYSTMRRGFAKWHSCS